MRDGIQFWLSMWFCSKGSHVFYSMGIVVVTLSWIWKLIGEMWTWNYTAEVPSRYRPTAKYYCIRQKWRAHRSIRMDTIKAFEWLFFLLLCVLLFRIGIFRHVCIKCITCILKSSRKTNRLSNTKCRRCCWCCGCAKNECDYRNV